MVSRRVQVDGGHTRGKIIQFLMFLKIVATPFTLLVTFILPSIFKSLFTLSQPCTFVALVILFPPWGVGGEGSRSEAA